MIDLKNLIVDPPPSDPPQACPHEALGTRCLVCKPADAGYRIVHGDCTVDEESLIASWRKLRPDVPPPRELLLEAWHAIKNAMAIYDYVDKRLASNPEPVDLGCMWEDLEAALERLKTHALPGGYFREEFDKAIAEDPPPRRTAPIPEALEFEFIDLLGQRYREGVVAAKNQIAHVARVIADLAKRNRWTISKLRHIPRSEYAGGAR